MENSSCYWAPSWTAALAALLGARLISASLNLIHDCDEVFNYWEPLHYILYGYGLQTWEYSSKFALRAWLYIFLHGSVAAPLAWLQGSSQDKVAIFVFTRSILGALSACAETLLYRAVLRTCGPRTARTMLLMLLTSSGMFVASTALLPSTFAMYAVTVASAAVMLDQPFPVIAAGAIGVLWGWVVAAVAFVPHALYVLFAAPLHESLTAAVALSMVLAGTLAAVDRLCYGSWQVSLLNFLRYNVQGGGQSSLYGVEGHEYYFKTGGLAYNLGLPLALLLPVVKLLQWLSQPRQHTLAPGDSAVNESSGDRSDNSKGNSKGSSRGHTEGNSSSSSSSHPGVLLHRPLHHAARQPAQQLLPLQSMQQPKQQQQQQQQQQQKKKKKRQKRKREGQLGERLSLRVAAAMAPLWLWLGTISCLPHKEERFLFVVYPLVCSCAAMALDGIAALIEGPAVNDRARRKRSHLQRWRRVFAATVHWTTLALIVSLSLSRSIALLKGYSAPMALYGALPREPPHTEGHTVAVCVADEWYRFPSSFFLPGPRYRLQFLDSAFDGHLPRPFNSSEGGTTAAPRQLNDRNQREPANYWTSSSKCLFFTGFVLPSDATPSDWEYIAKLPFLQPQASPASTRSFHLPGLSSRRNVYRTMYMWKRIPTTRLRL